MSQTPPARARARAAVRLFAGGLVLESVVAALALHFWPGELVASFGWHLGLAAAAAAVCAALVRAPFTALGLVLLAGLHAGPEARTFLSVPRGTTEAQAVRVAAANVLWSNPERDAVERWVREVDPDVLAVCELSQATRLLLETRLEEWPHRLRWPVLEHEWDAGTWGLALFSKLPLEEPSIEFSALSSGFPILCARVRSGGTELALRSVHAMRPGNGWRIEVRRGVFDRLGELCRDEPQALALGDFNVAPTSPWFGRLLDAGRLSDTRPGYGRQPTWATPFWSGRWWIPIDHALVGAGLIVQGRRTGAIPGSDHRAVIVEVAAR